jgi:hypothetical protein
MHGLVTLSGLQTRALVRRLTRGVRSVKGAVLFVFGVAVVGLWLAPSVWQAHVVGRTDPRAVLDLAPVLLLASCLLTVITSGGEKAIAFSPAEVDFLFPGPFTRRQLLAFKIGKSLGGIAFSSLLLSVVLLRHARAWPAAWAGLALAMLFLQMFGVAITLVAQSIGERAYTRGRKVVLGLVIVLALAWVLPRMSAGGGRPGFLEMAKSLRASRVGHVLLAPLEAFGRLFVADRLWPDAFVYGGIALGIDVLLVFVVFYLDADYLEAAAARSQVLYDRLQRVRRGGGLAAIGAPAKGRWAMPRLPYWAGAGPVVWRQGTTALRNSKGLLMVLLILAIAVGPLVLSANRDGNLSGSVVGAMAWMTLIVGSWIRFDFRGDLDQMDHLKSLPASGWAISAGQLVTPAVLMTLCHALVVASVMAATRRWDPVLAFAAVVSAPFNAMMFAVENLIFLVFPTRGAQNPTDFQGYGRQLLILFAKGIILLIACGIAALVAYVGHQLTGSWTASAVTAAFVLTAEAVALVPAVAWAYGRFDVSRDMPG